MISDTSGTGRKTYPAHEACGSLGTERGACVGGTHVGFDNVLAPALLTPHRDEELPLRHRMFACSMSEEQADFSGCQRYVPSVPNYRTLREIDCQVAGDGGTVAVRAAAR